jgi:hypothetical protein
MKQFLLFLVLNFVVFLELSDIHGLLQEFLAQFNWKDKFVAFLDLFTLE